MRGKQNIGTYHLCGLIVMKYGVLTFVEHSGSVQACADIALSFFLTDTPKKIFYNKSLIKL